MEIGMLQPKVVAAMAKLVAKKLIIKFNYSNLLNNVTFLQFNSKIKQ